MASQEPLKILSFDGCGPGGLANLILLAKIMERIRVAKGLDYTPRPCECFDLIGGTSTGGIIAIMLGRLGMSVEECIEAYCLVAAETPVIQRKLMEHNGAWQVSSGRALEKAIRRAIGEWCPETECVSHWKQDFSGTPTCRHYISMLLSKVTTRWLYKNMSSSDATNFLHNESMLFRDKSCTKTVVLTLTKDNIDARPTLFRTYDTSTAFESCKIWEVARAAVATGGLFTPVKLGRDEIEFIDAAFSFNNPCEQLIAEGREQFGERTQLCVLSLGTGLGDVAPIKNNSKDAVFEALTKMILSSRKVALSLEKQYADSDQYYRFDIDCARNITAVNSETLAEIWNITSEYVSKNERAINQFVCRLTGSTSVCGQGTSKPDGAAGEEP